MISLKDGIKFRNQICEKKFSAKQLFITLLISNILLYVLIPTDATEKPSINIPANFVIIKIPAQLNTVFEEGKEVTLISRKDQWQTSAILLRELAPQNDMFSSDVSNSFEIAVNALETQRIIQSQMAIYPKFNYGVKREKSHPTRDASF